MAKATTKAKKSTENGVNQFKKDISSGNLGRLYIVSGDEDYLRQHYITAAQQAVVGDSPFAEFNSFVFDGKGMRLDDLRDAIESYPSMAEQKIVLVRDFDLYKMPAEFGEYLTQTLEDLPAYLVLIFAYQTIPLKQDKRLKIHKLLEKQACFAEFEHLKGAALHDWIRRRFAAQSCAIDDTVAAYMVFQCGASMTNLITEIEKASAFCTTGQITNYHIDSVCTRVLDAVVFDLTDAITERKFAKAMLVVHDLLGQKNEEIMIFGAVSKHMQRLYIAKLGNEARLPERQLMAQLGTNSSYYAQRMMTASRGVSMAGLRQAVLICGETDLALKSTAGDRVKMMELALLGIANAFEEQGR